MSQWSLYSFLIFNDKKIEMDNNIALIEYLASFWNAEAVRKVQESRRSSPEHNFKNNEEFEEFIKAGEYKNNPLVDAIVKLKNMENNQTGNLDAQSNNRDSRRMPTDLSSIYKTLGSFNKGE